MKRIIILFAIGAAMIGCNENKKENENLQAQDTIIEENVDGSDNSEEESVFNVAPVEHATMVINWNKEVIYVDPIGGGSAFKGYTKPTMILVTDIHEDHLNIETLTQVTTDSTQIIVPQAVADKLPKDIKGVVTVLSNGSIVNKMGFAIEAIPMYNLRKEALKFHTKGRGNGYVLEKDGKRVYISGDTEDIPEMRNLKNIDIAFVCMNLPYTMPVDAAASAVLEFQPKTVYPYHYRGTEGLSDIDKFKSLVEAGNKDIKVTQLDWYPNQK